MVRAALARPLLAVAAAALTLAVTSCGQDDSESVTAVDALVQDIIAGDGEAACDRVAFFGEGVPPVGPNCPEVVIRLSPESGLDDDALSVSAADGPCEGHEDLDGVQVQFANGLDLCVAVGTVEGSPVINAGDLPSLMTFGAAPADE